MQGGRVITLTSHRCLVLQRGALGTVFAELHCEFSRGWEGLIIVAVLGKVFMCRWPEQMVPVFSYPRSEEENPQRSFLALSSPQLPAYVGHSLRKIWRVAQPLFRFLYCRQPILRGLNLYRRCAGARTHRVQHECLGQEIQTIAGDSLVWK